MKLLLLSLGLAVINKYVDKSTKIGFIPTAGDAYPDPYFVRDDRSRLVKMGYDITDIDLSNISTEEAKKLISKVDTLFVAGGNTFYLMEQISEKNLTNTIKEFINSNKWYIGASAGAVILSPSIEPIKGIDDISILKGKDIPQSLDVINFIPLPHYGKPKYIDKYLSIIEEYKGKFTITLLKDDEALVLKDGLAPNKEKSELILHD